jgi:hypothetical protein
MDINTSEGNYMSNVINYFLGNTIFILTLTERGDPDQHPQVVQDKSPLQQYIFNNPEDAIDAAQNVTAAIHQALLENEEAGVDPEVRMLPKVVEQSQDILFAMELRDTEGDTLYRVYITAFRKQGREWA